MPTARLPLNLASSQTNSKPSSGSISSKDLLQRPKRTPANDLKPKTNSREERKPMQRQTTYAEPTSVPSLPCPNCARNILATGFYNYCIESVGLREDNRTDVTEGRIYMDHDESGHETGDHECQTDAYCAECN